CVRPGWPRREGTNIGIARCAVKQNVESTSQIIPAHMVRLFVHRRKHATGSSIANVVVSPWKPANYGLKSQGEPRPWSTEGYPSTTRREVSYCATDGPRVAGAGSGGPPADRAPART